MCVALDETESKKTQRPLTCEANVLVFYSLHVEPDGGDGGHHLPQLELVKNGSLTGCVQTHL